MIKLTNNERKTLKLLISNSRMSDSEIAEQLHISSVAIGKIRKKLEKTVIKRYSLQVNYEELGTRVFAFAFAKITKEGEEVGEKEVEHRLLKNPHVIALARIPKGTITHLILYGFGDLVDRDKFFQSDNLREELHKLIQNQDLHTFSSHGILKNSIDDLLQKMIDDYEFNPGLITSFVKYFYD